MQALVSAYEEIAYQKEKGKRSDERSEPPSRGTVDLGTNKERCINANKFLPQSHSKDLSAGRIVESSVAEQTYGRRPRGLPSTSIWCRS